jgi:hypothetical protein
MASNNYNKPDNNSENLDYEINIQNGFKKITNEQKSSNNLNIQTLSPIKNKKIKQFENILSQKFINLIDLKTAAWNGVPSGKIIIKHFRILQFTS